MAGEDVERGRTWRVEVAAMESEREVRRGRNVRVKKREENSLAVEVV
jgi:hypothetical protein